MFSFTPLQGFFSPFPHGTRSLSVNTAYLALEDGPPSFKQGFSCPALLTKQPIESAIFYLPGYHRLWRGFPTDFDYITDF